MELKNLLNSLPVTDPLFNIFIGSTIVLVFILLSMSVFFVVTLFKKTKELEVDEEILERAAYDHALKIMDYARKESLKILTDSQIKAQKSVTEASKLSLTARKDLQDRLRALYTKQTDYLEQLGSDLLESYKKNIQEEKQEGLKALQETTKYIKDELTEEVAQFKETLVKGTIKTQEEVEAHIREESAQLEQELKDYKKQRMAALEDQLFAILAKVSTKYLGKSLNVSEQERLILAMLNEELAGER